MASSRPHRRRQQLFLRRPTDKKVQWSDANALGNKDKATVVPKLKEAFDAGSAAHGTGHLGTLIQNPGRSKLHCTMVTLMRKLALVPPSS